MSTKRANIYAYPKFKGRYGDYFLFRLTGSGLGNNLFVWAKYMVFVKKYNCTPIQPTWAQFNFTKNKYFLEHLKRHNLGFFKATEGSVKGIKKLFVLMRSKNVDYLEFEESYELSKDSITRFHKNVVNISGMHDYFSYMMDDHEYIKGQLLQITRNKHKSGLKFNFDNSVSLHVRLGDFGKSDTQNVNNTNMRLGLDWYKEIIFQIRSVTHQDIKFFIFSDGSDKELEELLKMKNVHRVSFGSALSDLIALSCSNMLVASGSTYSMWASYIGRMPVIWHHKKLLQRVYFDQPAWEMECDEKNRLTDDQLTVVSNYFNNEDKK